MKHYLSVLAFLVFSITAVSLPPPKREFRGAWVHVINQSRYQGMTTLEMKQYFSSLLNDLADNNINTLIFQVRPSADAFYKSNIEPWSRYLTGIQGQNPRDGFDPMVFLIEEAHRRNMEFHAWLNPYRVTASQNDVLCRDHIYFREPDRFIKYGNQIFFDPGLPQNRKLICEVVNDIVTRYDIDAIHFDDYFYPYPLAGERFDDDFSFGVYAHRQGFSANRRADWRRNNVTLLIRQVRNTIIAAKPWVRFGISPFGIYRNKRNTAGGSGTGSATNGLQNYDDLYADVLLWAEKGWIDYIIPQVYWEIGYQPADYEILVDWWSRNVKNIHVYIGQDIARTVKKPDPADLSKNQLPRKIMLERKLPSVGGHCWWPGYDIVSNTAGIADSLKRNYQRYPALIPAYTQMHNKRPKDVKSLRAEWTPDGYILHWQRNGDITNPENAQYYVIYRFDKKQKADLTNPANIVAISREPYYKLPYLNGRNKYKYVVTSVDRFHNESKKGKTRKVKL
ncbi:MAG: family 10 glycosylhydrolase [Dysgonamonadaceae bacterium]|jgi:uncharacterized lipoprotein YddW (UPF0748 family)|nr:family 10 glycosylhydrolase [Dysgonamonadaceae bacterium]